MPEIKPGSAFARDYVPQLDIAEQARSDTKSKQVSRSREKRMTDADPITRMAARGTIPGMGSDAEVGWERAKIIRKASSL